MTKEEMAELCDAVSKDMGRASQHSGDVADRIGFALMCAAWHLRGEPSFVERNDELKKRYP